jgi:hypothetical protein
MAATIDEINAEVTKGWAGREDNLIKQVTIWRRIASSAKRPTALCSWDTPAMRKRHHYSAFLCESTTISNKHL